jgi:hypothetical protein
MILLFFGINVYRFTCSAKDYLQAAINMPGSSFPIAAGKAITKK